MKRNLTGILGCMCLTAVLVAAFSPAVQAVDVYVSTFGDGWIWKVDSETGQASVIATGYQQARDVAIDAEGILHISGRFNGIKRIDTKTGSPLSDVGTNICGASGLAIDGDGNVYANTDSFPCAHSGVWRIDGGTATTATRIIPPMGVRGSGLAFGTSGPYNGCLLANISEGGFGVGAYAACPPFFVPVTPLAIGGYGIATDGLGNIYQSQSGGYCGGAPGHPYSYAGIINQYDPKGVFIEQVASGLQFPAYLEFDEVDNLYFTEITCEDSFAGHLSMLSPDGTKTIIAQIPGEPYGVAVDLPVLRDARIVTTLPAEGVALDNSSFSTPPDQITYEPDQTVIEWIFSKFSITNLKNLLFQVTMQNPVSGENRTIVDQLELTYTDLEDNPVRTVIGPASIQVQNLEVDPTLELAISMNKPAYGANETASIEVTVDNAGQSDRSVDLLVEIRDPDGNVVKEVATLTAISIPAGVSQILGNMAYPIGIQTAGNYVAFARLMEGSVTVREADFAFAIVPTRGLTTEIGVDQQSYTANEDVTLSSSVQSTSLNADLTGVQARITILRPGARPLFSDVRTIGDLAPRERVDIQSNWNTGATAAGSYTVELRVTTAEGLISVSTTQILITSSLTQAASLAGTISLFPSPIIEGELTTVHYTLENIGNVVDIPNLSVEILVIDPYTGIVVRTLTDAASLNTGELFENDIPFDSGGLDPIPHVFVLNGIITVQGRDGSMMITQTLDNATLIISPNPNNAPLSDAGPDVQGFIGQVVALDGSGSFDPDSDPITYHWHFTSVPESSQITDLDLVNGASPNPAFIPDAKGIYTLSLVVNDGLLDSPIDLVSVFVNPPPTIKIHPEKINLKSNGGSKSITGVLSSPVLSSFEFFTAQDGITVIAAFSLENAYMDMNGDTVTFTMAAEDYEGDDRVEAVDSDGNGEIDTYQLTLKFDRDDIIAGFTDAGGNVRILEDTDLTSTVLGDDIQIGSDVNTVLGP